MNIKEKVEEILLGILYKDKVEDIDMDKIDKLYRKEMEKEIKGILSKWQSAIKKSIDTKSCLDRNMMENYYYEAFKQSISHKKDK